VKSLKLLLCKKSLARKMDFPRDYIAEKGMFEPKPGKCVTARKRRL
jgi:hypothetical protein